MSPSTPSRTRKAPSKKRTRHDRAEDSILANGEEEDLDIKSPNPKRQNTSMKSDCKSVSVAPLASPGLYHRSQVKGVLHAPIEGNCNNENSSDGEGSPPPPPPSQDVFVPHSHAKSSIGQEGQFSKDQEMIEDIICTSNNDLDKVASAHFGRGYLWCFVLLGVLMALICCILWTSVLLYDLAEITLSENRCRATLASFQQSSSSQAREEFYIQELEKQLQYWKRQAKQNEAFVQGYKEQYQENLEQLAGS